MLEYVGGVLEVTATKKSLNLQVLEFFYGYQSNTSGTNTIVKDMGKDPKLTQHLFI